MAKNRPSKPGSNKKRRTKAVARARNQRSNGTRDFSDPADLIESISSRWVRETQKPGDTIKHFVASTIGTVIAAKLIIGLGNGGELRCELDSGAVYTIEKESDEFANSAFRPVAEMARAVAS